jgi:hypothetical protein
VGEGRNRRPTTKEATGMISTHLIRLAQALVLAGFLAALATPGAFASSSSGVPTPDWIERSVAAHPYVQGVIDLSAPDWIERYAAAHPYGQRLIDPSAPDWIERYAAARAYGQGVSDGRSPDTRQAVDNSSLQLVDRRSPDTVGAESGRRPVVIADHDRFQRGDAGIAGGFAAAILALLAASMLLWSRRHARGRVRTT